MSTKSKKAPVKVKAPKFKMPVKLAECADLLYSTREKRYEIQRTVKELEEQESAMKDYLLLNLKKSKASGIGGKLARVTMSSREVPTPDNWELIHKYIKDTDSFELLQKRLSTEAVVERWDAGTAIPGVGKMAVTSLSINKV